MLIFQQRYGRYEFSEKTRKLTNIYPTLPSFYTVFEGFYANLYKFYFGRKTTKIPAKRMPSLNQIL